MKFVFVCVSVGFVCLPTCASLHGWLWLSICDPLRESSGDHGSACVSRLFIPLSVVLDDTNYLLSPMVNHWYCVCLWCFFRIHPEPDYIVYALRVCVRGHVWTLHVFVCLCVCDVWDARVFRCHRKMAISVLLKLYLNHTNILCNKWNRRIISYFNCPMSYALSRRCDRARPEPEHNF